MWSRDQNERLAGVLCYAEPAVRKLKFKEIDEAINYEIDGLVVSLVGHMDGQAGDEPCSYGYNPTVVEQYKQRHGVDPLTEDVDPHKFYAIHGEGFTEFVRSASEVVRAKGKTFICATRTDGAAQMQARHLSATPWRSATCATAKAHCPSPRDSI